jgi:hypothetical protein
MYTMLGRLMFYIMLGLYLTVHVDVRRRDVVVLSMTVVVVVMVQHLRNWPAQHNIILIRII